MQGLLFGLELIKKVFQMFNPVISSQKDLVNDFLTEDIKKIDKVNFNKAHEIITSNKFDNMGDIFLNISFGSIS